MEKPSKLMGRKILKFLSKAAHPAVTFHSPPPSPRKTSGPMISLIPAEARRKPRNGNGISFSSKEPTSPKVSCMGQVNGKKKKKKKIKPKSKTNNRVGPPPQESTTCNLVSCAPKDVKKKKNPPRVLTQVPKVAPQKEGSNKKCHDGIACSFDSSRGPERVPSLGQMKSFASGRGVLADFDLILEVHGDQIQDYDQDHDKEKKEKTEVSLRKRRTISPLTPLQL